MCFHRVTQPGNLIRTGQKKIETEHVHEHEVVGDEVLSYLSKFWKGLDIKILLRTMSAAPKKKLTFKGDNGATKK